MQTIFHPAGSRGFASHGWLTTHHSFSFASYYDPERMGFGALRVLNDDTIAPGAGFGKHPHDNMEIITIVLSGALRHEDSIGNSAVITAGEVQVMSAGTGVVHAEWNASEKDPLTLFQIWILSDSRDVKSRYDQKRFDPERYRNNFYQVVGKIGESEIGIHQDARIFLGQFDAGREVQYTLKNLTQGVYFFVVDGEGRIESEVVHPRDGLGVWDTKTIAIFAEKELFLMAIEVPLTEA